eukprot:752932-Hanusia_phi.AAC.9
MGGTASELMGRKEITVVACNAAGRSKTVVVVQVVEAITEFNYSRGTRTGETTTFPFHYTSPFDSESPMVGGGTVEEFLLVGELPEGVLLDPLTGRLTGSPSFPSEGGEVADREVVIVARNKISEQRVHARFVPVSSLLVRILDLFTALPIPRVSLRLVCLSVQDSSSSSSSSTAQQGKDKTPPSALEDSGWLTGSAQGNCRMTAKAGRLYKLSVEKSGYEMMEMEISIIAGSDNSVCAVLCQKLKENQCAIALLHNGFVPGERRS